MPQKELNERVLYNHYGEENELKFPEIGNVFDNKLKQVKNENERSIKRAKIQKKVDKDLYLRAKHKLSSDKKRDQKSLKVERKNKIYVINESLKSIKKLSNYSNLVAFELKKVIKQLKENAKYLESSYKWSKNSADLPETKIKKFKLIKANALKKEQELLLYKNILSLLKEKNQNKDLDIAEKYPEFYNGNSKQINVIDNKIKLRISENKANAKKRKAALEKDIEAIKSSYKYSKKELDLKTIALIHDAEFEYNKTYKDHLEKYTDKKIQSLEKLESIKDKHKEIDLKVKNEKKQFVISQKQKILKLKLKNKYLVKVNYLSEIYKRQNIRIESIGMKKNKDKFKDIILFHEEKLNEICNIFIKIINNKNEINKNSKEVKSKLISKLKSLKLDFNNLSKTLNNSIKSLRTIIKDHEKEINNFIKNNKDKKILASYHFGILGKWEYASIIKKWKKCESNLDIDKEVSEYDYEGDYKQKVNNAYVEFANDWLKELDELNLDRKKSKISYIQAKSKDNFSHKHKEYLKFKKDTKIKWKKELDKIKSDVKSKNTTKSALKQKSKEYKIYSKEEISEYKLQDENKKYKGIISSFKFRYWGRRKIWKKVYGSKLVEAKRTTPIKSFKNLRLLAALMNIILPGLSEISLFKQYKKGILMIILSSIFYGLFVPFILGLTSSKFGGILGIIDMGASKHNWLLGQVPDARYYLLGAIISIILLIAVLIFNISSSITAFKTGKIMEQGVRPMGWIHTRRWLSNQGFPWLISLPGWILIIFIVVVPVLTSLLISFTNMGFNHEPPGRTVEWIQFQQYGKWWLFKDSGMGKSIVRVLEWTIIWTLLSSSLVIGLGTIIAVIVNQDRIKFKKLWRMIYIIPWAIPAFVTIMFLKSAFQSDADSLMNSALLKLHLISSPVDWNGNIWTVRMILILLQGWLGHSYIFLLITGNMQSIPKDIYEASSIDGAKNNQMFRHMTLPILLSSIAPLLISQFTFNFNNFTIISLFSGGGPAFKDPTPFLEGGTDILISWIYKLTTGVAQIDGNLGFSAAMTILAALISVGVASYGFAKSAAFRRF